MRLSGVVLILILSTTISCKRDNRPPGVMSEAQMADWMIDIYLAENRVQSLAVGRDSMYKLFLPRKDSLMRAKDIQDSTLQKSFAYYLENPARMERIYDIVIDSLSLKEQRLLPGGLPALKRQESQ